MMMTTNSGNDGAKSDMGLNMTLSLQLLASAAVFSTRWISIREASGIMISRDVGGIFLCHPLALSRSDEQFRVVEWWESGALE